MRFICEIYILCVIFRILEVIDHSITSQFPGKVANTVTGNSIVQVSIGKLYGLGVTETTIVSLITPEDSNIICCRGEA